MKPYDLLFILGIPFCLAIIFVSTQVSWRFYKSTDNLNRRLIRLFVGGLCLILVFGLLAAIDGMPKRELFTLAAIAGWVGCGALFILIGREMWNFLLKLRMMSAFRTLEESEE